MAEDLVLLGRVDEDLQSCWGEWALPTQQPAVHGLAAAFHDHRPAEVVLELGVKITWLAQDPARRERQNVICV